MLHIAIASGKGGTGKTTVATNLAVTLAEQGYSVCYADCDVEEPNGHIFLKPRIHRTIRVTVPVPQIDLDQCTLCGKCAEICQYNAIVCVGKEVLTFPQMCHGCGGCSLVCTEGAISETPREIGVVEVGAADGVGILQGRLHVAEPIAPPVIRKVKASVSETSQSSEGVCILDAPPGTSCPVIQTVRGADYVILVTEPTPFGLHDLELAVEMTRALGAPFAVVINRAGLANGRVRHYCDERDIHVLAEIPDDRRIAEAYSRGEMAIRTVGAYRDVFVDLWARVRDLTDGPKPGRARPEGESAPTGAPR